VMGVSWAAPGSANAFATISASSLTVDLTSPSPPVGALHHVVRDGVVTDLNGFGQDLTVSGSTTGRYAIVTATGIEGFGNFADFATGLGQHLTGGQKARLIGARGRFNDATVTFTAPTAGVILQ